MRYFLGKSKELEIDKNKKHKFLIQKWNDPVDNGAGTGNVFYYLNILEWDKVVIYPTKCHNQLNLTKEKKNANK